MSVSAGSNFSANEGTSYTFQARLRAGHRRTRIAGLSATADGAPAASPSHTYTDGPHTYTAALTVQDSAGHSGSASVVATVVNVAPTATESGPTSGTRALR